MTAILTTDIPSELLELLFKPLTEEEYEAGGIAKLDLTDLTLLYFYYIFIL